MKINIRNYNNILKKIYGEDSGVLENQFNRYDNLIQKHRDLFGEKDLHIFSTPGRTELGGNHTDHNHGCVLAAAVNLDSIAAASKTMNNTVVIHSEGYDDKFQVDLKNIAVIENEKGSTSALIRGIAARFKELGYKTGGFDACLTSDVLPGSGLSSSASIEVLIGTIFNALYNDNQIQPEILAQIGQYAENVYFGKPCGLMDQIACATGGIISIDFKDPVNPLVTKIDFDFEKQQYRMLVVDTGGSHADLTGDYAAVPAEMKSAAIFFGAEVLREVPIETYLEKIPSLRKQAGDRAVLRGLHFLQENERVAAQAGALKSGDFQKFLELVKASGDSSFKWLQNIYSPANINEQGVTLGLALTEKYVRDTGRGACRVHGGGFAGTIQVFLPVDTIGKFKEIMGAVFGSNSIQELSIRSVGTVQVI